MKKIVVLGGSFGGLTAALELRRMLGKGVEISVVSEDGRFVFLLAAMADNGLEKTRGYHTQGR